MEQNFGWALEELRAGNAVARKGWNAHHSLVLQHPDEHSKMTQSYIYMNIAQGGRVPWVASQTDILAKDWGVVNI